VDNDAYVDYSYEEEEEMDDDTSQAADN